MAYRFNHEKVRERREQLGLTQEQLAQKAGLVTSTIIQLENGSKEPKVKTIALIANALQTKLEYFFAA